MSEYVRNTLTSDGSPRYYFVKCMAVLTGFFRDADFVVNSSSSSGLIANKPLEPAEKSDVPQSDHGSLVSRTEVDLA